jgi:hypothetical protein
MRARLTALAALIAAASLTGGTAAHAQAVVRPNAFYAEDQGYGWTLAAAEDAATAQLFIDYDGCVPPVDVVYYTESPDGRWFADVAAYCEGDV